MIRTIISKIVGLLNPPAPRWLDRFVHRTIAEEIAAHEAELADARVKHAGDPARIAEIEEGLSDLRKRQSSLS